MFCKLPELTMKFKNTSIWCISSKTSSDPMVNVNKRDFFQTKFIVGNHSVKTHSSRMVPQQKKFGPRKTAPTQITKSRLPVSFFPRFSVRNPDKSLNKLGTDMNNWRWMEVVYLCRRDCKACGIIWARVDVFAHFYQLLYVIDCSQNFISHLLQCRGFVEGTHALRWTSFAFCTIFRTLLFYKMNFLLLVILFFTFFNRTTFSPCTALYTSIYIMTKVMEPSDANNAWAHTMLVFLHLHAAVINALNAAKASHLFINAQVLLSTMSYQIHWFVQINTR